MAVVDKVNKKYGSGTIHTLAEGIQKNGKCNSISDQKVLRPVGVIFP